MKELPLLLKQRIKKITEIKSVILQIDQQTKEAGQASLNSASELVVSKSILSIVDLIRKESQSVGEKLGYASACKDMSQVLQIAIKRCEDVESSLQELLSELDDFLAEEKVENSEGESLPLDFREESEDLS
jgi:hypothetical protein